jgi:hypothetical protein
MSWDYALERIYTSPRPQRYRDSCEMQGKLNALMPASQIVGMQLAALPSPERSRRRSNQLINASGNGLTRQRQV